jgi:hypothetical protein
MLSVVWETTVQLRQSQPLAEECVSLLFVELFYGIEYLQPP